MLAWREFDTVHHKVKQRMAGMFKFGGPDCKVCRIIRVYLMVAVPMLMMMWLQPEVRFPDGIDARAWLGYGIGIALVVMIAWRVYFDYYRKRR